MTMPAQGGPYGKLCALARVRGLHVELRTMNGERGPVLRQLAVTDCDGTDVFTCQLTVLSLDQAATELLAAVAQRKKNT